MKIVEEKGKLFGIINIVDIGIVLLVIFGVVAVGYKMLLKNASDRETVCIRYTICAEGLRQQSVDAINKSHDNIIDAENDDALGKIVGVEKKNAVQFVAMADGTYKLAEHPEKYDLYVTLEVDGISTSEGIHTVSGKKIMYGDTIGINNGYSQMFGTVENIEIIK